MDEKNKELLASNIEGRQKEEEVEAPDEDEDDEGKEDDENDEMVIKPTLTAR